jgi:2-polyprenyl-6-methoxyphenol hydroxylase-like FAD-dependent oxidoreductase
MDMETIETDVLVVGAGPVGLALAGDLGWRGHRCVIVERGDGTIGQPKMDQVGIRTMEYCRRWGLVPDVEASPYNRDRPQDNIYLTALTGWELGREPFRSMRDDRPPPYSPQKRERCPQNMFDPILQKFARSHAGVALKLRHKFLSLDGDDQGVTATVQDLDHDRTLVIRAKYLVGADGGRSRVREQLGITMSGRGLLTHTTNVVFRAPGLDALHPTRPGYRYIFVGPQGTWATLVAIDGHDRWRMSIIGSTEPRTYTEDELKSLAHRAMGKPFELEILSILPWQRQELVADTYRKGRCLLAGDAAHLTSPTGGLGMNTGIGDAADLGWKLSALLQGWGGPRLLDSYEVERERVGHAFSEAMKHEWYLDNVHVGYRYLGSPVIAYEPEDPGQLAREAAETARYTPSTQPGRRAPHAWLADGSSTHDHFGRAYVLVDTVGTADARLDALRAAARERRVPFAIACWPADGLPALYQRRYVLVRPDDTVAWRGDALPADVDRLLATVTGY